MNQRRTTKLTDKILIAIFSIYKYPNFIISLFILYFSASFFKFLYIGIAIGKTIKNKYPIISAIFFIFSAINIKPTKYNKYKAINIFEFLCSDSVKSLPQFQQVLLPNSFNLLQFGHRKLSVPIV
jgi:hypothetical protein